MKAERWQQVERLYHAALECAPDERAAFLAEACDGDEELRREVGELLAFDDPAASFIEMSAIEIAARALADDPLSREPTGKLESSSVERRIGAHHLLSLLGRGGMGEVYLAHDTRLGRKVAIKVLPAEFTSDQERVRRFAQEAHAASSLNHPNIITIYEIGEAGAEDGGTHYIVTEYVEGETLRQRMESALQKRMELTEALDVAVQIAAALSAAHAEGIVHRDIKPENVIIRRDGLVKVLDFGLAKLAEQPQAVDTEAATSAQVKTATGMVMGTPGYMSPEQARGLAADARTDIWGLGVVLYEMLAGRAPFAGQTSSDALAALLKDEPLPLTDYAPEVPRELERIVNRALCKDCAERYQSIGDLLNDLKQLRQELMIADSKGRHPQIEHLKTEVKPRRWRAMFAVAAFVAFAGIAFGLYRWIGQTQPHTKVGAPDPKVAPFTSFPGGESEPAFSPDGNRIAFVWRGPKDDNADIYVKQPGAEGLQRLTTDPADDTGPAWSPDARHIAFLRRSSTGSGIYSVPALGGGERKLSEVFNGAGRSGHTHWPPNQNPNWSPDGQSLAIVDKGSPQEPFSIFSLARETGEKRRLTTPPATAYGDTSPAFSPDGKLLAFVRVPGIGVADVYLMPAAGGEPRRLTFNYQPVGRVAWTPDNREIVFEMGAMVGMGGLWKVSTAGGAPERLVAAGQMVLDPAISLAGGRLAYTQALYDTNIWRLELSGAKSRSQAPKEFIVSTQIDTWPEYSPDGKRILFLSHRSGSYEIWVCGTEGENPVQLTDLNAHTGTPHWSSDSRHIVFDSRREGNADIYVISAEGGQPRRLTTEHGEDITPSWSRDGRWIYFGSTRSGSLQIWKMPAEGGEARQVTKQGGFEGFESPDGRFFYYAKGRYIPGIWKIPVAGGEETLVLDHHQAGFRRAWKVVDEGIYFAAAETPSRPMIEFFNFATGKLTQIATVDKQFGSGLSISPDGQWLIYVQRDQTAQDIMLMENFR